MGRLTLDISCDPLPEIIFPWHAGKFQLSVDRDRRRGHDAVFNSALRMLGDINLDQADIWELAFYLLDCACDQLLGRLALRSTGGRE